MGRTDELRAFVEEVHPDLDLYTYYQLLELPEGAPLAEIRQAFYRQAARLHPDRFAGLADEVVRAKLVAVYARIAEAYRVLSDPKKREGYDLGVRSGQLRYVETEREKKGPQSPEDSLQRPEAKKFLRLALQASRAGDAKGAHMNLKFALSYEPHSTYLQEQLAAAEAQLKAKGSFTSSGGGR
jgi:curved DNA-binding protein CbpA